MQSDVANSPIKLGSFRRDRLLSFVNSALHMLPSSVATKSASLLYSLQPHRLPVLLELARLSLAALLSPRRALRVPSLDAAEGKPKGLAGLAARVSPADTLAGYARGFFLFSHTGPLKWWAPEQRMVLFFDEAHIEKTTRRLLRNSRFKITFDRAFADVMSGCAETRDGRPPLTWITPRMKRLFQTLHEHGHAHSVEIWNQEGALVGGLYGLSVGNVFFTESQFHRERDASKVAFAVLNAHLSHWGFAMNDGKHQTPYLSANGFRLIARTDFSQITQAHCHAPRPPGRWTVDEALDVDRWATETPAHIAGETLAPRATTTDQITQNVKF